MTLIQNMSPLTPGINYNSAFLLVAQRALTKVTIIAVLAVTPSLLFAHDPIISDDLSGVINKKFALGVAASYNRFDTSLQFTNLENGRSIFIDAEQSLGLPETNFSPLLYGTWQINSKHSVGFNFFAADRVGSVFVIDKTLDNLKVTGNVTLSDKSKFYYLNYGYTFVEKPDSRVRGILGLYGIDLKLGVEAKGAIELDGEIVASGKYAEDIDQLIPLPVIGVDYYFMATPKWGLGSRFALIGGSYADYTAIVIDARILARYQMMPHVALMMGANYFKGDIEIKDTESSKDIDYGYDGFFLGLDFNW